MRMGSVIPSKIIMGITVGYICSLDAISSSCRLGIFSRQYRLSHSVLVSWVKGL